MFRSTLLAETLRLVQNRPPELTYAIICEETNIGRRWLEQFAQGKFKDPGVSRVEALYNYLCNRAKA